MSKIGKKILLGRDIVNDVVTISDDVSDDDYFICSGKLATNILVPKAYVVEINEKDIELECCAIKKNYIRIDAPDFVEISSLPVNFNFSDFSVYVKIKKHTDELKVVKTSKKSVHFIDENGKIRYTGFANIKKIINYNPEQKISVDTEKPANKTKKKESLATAEKKDKKKKNTENKEKAKAYAAAKGRDPEAVGGTPKSVNIPEPVENTDKKFVNILEVPYDVDYKKEGRDVYMDLPDGRHSLKVRRSNGGRVFWDDLKTGQYSATSWKKVNKDENIKVYEYK